VIVVREPAQVQGGPGLVVPDVHVDHGPVRHAAPAQLIDRWLEDGAQHLLGEPGRRPGQRGVGAHPAGVRPLVAVARALEVLRGQQRHGSASVGQREQRHLGPVQELNARFGDPETHS